MLTSLQIHRGGHWNSDSMTGCYLTSLPREFMRGQAGFDPDYSGSYYVPRTAIEPPEELGKMVFPHVDYWSKCYESKGIDLRYPDIEQNMAGQAFLQLLERLRIVFLPVS